MKYDKLIVRMNVLVTPEMYRALKKKQHEGLTMAWYIRMAIEKALALDEYPDKKKRR